MNRPFDHAAHVVAITAASEMQHSKAPRLLLLTGIAASGTDFDVVLMDMQMPIVDGLQATRAIRALTGQRGRVAIIAVTAQAFADQLATCRKAVMTDEPAEATAPEVDPAAESAPPMFNRVLFDRTADILEARAVAKYLAGIETLAQDLAQHLSQRGRQSADLAELAAKAHLLAGSAGMFGFERLAALGRSLEYGVHTQSPRVPSLCDKLLQTLQTTLEQVRLLALQSETV